MSLYDPFFYCCVIRLLRTFPKLVYKHQAIVEAWDLGQHRREYSRYLCWSVGFLWLDRCQHGGG